MKPILTTILMCLLCFTGWAQVQKATVDQVERVNNLVSSFATLNKPLYVQFKDGSFSSVAKTRYIEMGVLRPDPQCDTMLLGEYEVRTAGLGGDRFTGHLCRRLIRDYYSTEARLDTTARYYTWDYFYLEGDSLSLKEGPGTLILVQVTNRKFSYVTTEGQTNTVVVLDAGKRISYEQFKSLVAAQTEEKKQTNNVPATK